MASTAVATATRLRYTIGPMDRRPFIHVGLAATLATLLATGPAAGAAR